MTNLHENLYILAAVLITVLCDHDTGKKDEYACGKEKRNTYWNTSSEEPTYIDFFVPINWNHITPVECLSIEVDDIAVVLTIGKRDCPDNIDDPKEIAGLKEDHVIIGWNRIFLRLIAISSKTVANLIVNDQNGNDWLKSSVNVSFSVNSQKFLKTRGLHSIINCNSEQNVYKVSSVYKVPAIFNKKFATFSITQSSSDAAHLALELNGNLILLCSNGQQNLSTYCRKCNHTLQGNKEYQLRLSSSMFTNQDIVYYEKFTAFEITFYSIERYSFHIKTSSKQNYNKSRLLFQRPMQSSEPKGSLDISELDMECKSLILTCAIGAFALLTFLIGISISKAAKSNRRNLAVTKANCDKETKENLDQPPLKTQTGSLCNDDYEIRNSHYISLEGRHIHKENEETHLPKTAEDEYEMYKMPWSQNAPRYNPEAKESDYEMPNLLYENLEARKKSLNGSD